MGAMQTEPLFRVPEVIAKELSRHLEEQIVFGELAPSSRLIEEDIVRRYGVSRSPVREALRMLEQDGLALRESRRGVRVSPLGLKDLDEVYSCRLALEGLAAEEAANNRSADDVPGLQAALSDLATASEANDIRAYFLRNVALTEKIHAVSGNQTLRRLLGTIGKQALRYRYLAYSQSPEMIDVSLEGNRAIVEAIVRQNARHARSLTEDLMQRSWRVIRQHVASAEMPIAASLRQAPEGVRH
jgi:GntR family transcriptional regulator, rspAB operon transcriptional repressor